MQELKNKDAAVVVFSGGQDSTTCLFWALKRYKKVIALSFDYHQKHVKELECAKKICRDHEVEHHIMDMSLLNQLAPNSLTRVDIKVDESAPEEGTPNSFVDGRNLLFLSYAAVFPTSILAAAKMVPSPPITRIHCVPSGISIEVTFLLYWSYTLHTAPILVI